MCYPGLAGGTLRAGKRLDSEHFKPFVDIAKLFAGKCHHWAFPRHIAKQKLFRSKCHHRTRARSSSEGRAMSITRLHARFERIERAYMEALAGRPPASVMCGTCCRRSSHKCRTPSSRRSSRRCAGRRARTCTTPIGWSSGGARDDARTSRWRCSSPPWCCWRSPSMSRRRSHGCGG